MTSFTLDTNCLVAVDEDRPEKPFVLELLDAGKDGLVDIAMLASSASEKQPGGDHLDSFHEFKARLENMGFGSIELLQPLGRYGLTFWDYCLWGSEESIARERHIFETLFPTTPAVWPDFAAAMEIDGSDLTSADAWRWRNRLCDAQGFWSHEFNERDFFVTSDKNFKRKLNAQSGFPSARILTPKEAAALIFDDQQN